MTRFVAFLRGVNVAGTWVKMEDVRKAMGSAGYENVETFIQSGNLYFESTNNDIRSLEKRISKDVSHLAKGDVTVVVFPIADLIVLLKSNPFAKLKLKSEDKRFVLFLKEKPDKVRLPLTTKEKDVEIFYCRDRIACGIGRKRNGKFTYPNLLVEKTWGSPSTTRFWHTFEEMMEVFTQY